MFGFARGCGSGRGGKICLICFFGNCTFTCGLSFLTARRINSPVYADAAGDPAKKTTTSSQPLTYDPLIDLPSDTAFCNNLPISTSVNTVRLGYCAFNVKPVISPACCNTRYNCCTRGRILAITFSKFGAGATRGATGVDIYCGGSIRGCGGGDATVDVLLSKSTGGESTLRRKIFLRCCFCPRLPGSTAV